MATTTQVNAPPLLEDSVSSHLRNALQIVGLLLEQITYYNMASGRRDELAGALGAIRDRVGAAVVLAERKSETTAAVDGLEMDEMCENPVPGAGCSCRSFEKDGECAHTRYAAYAASGTTPAAPEVVDNGEGAE